MPKISVPDIQKFQISPRKHASGLPSVSLGESDKLTDFSFFSLEGGSLPLVWVTRGGGKKNKKNSYEEGGH